MYELEEKMIAKLIKKIAAAGLLCTLFAVGFTAYAATGDVAGNIYCTDIKTYIYHSPITSYNIGGKTVIDAEILNWYYGFDVYWYADTRRLEITDKGGSFESLQAMSGELVESAVETVGDVFGHYYETDIVTTLNGEQIESYNIGGRTFIVAEAMRDFGYNVDWNSEERTLTITKPMDFYKITTDYGVLKTTHNMVEPTYFGMTERGLLLTDRDGNNFELNLKSNCVLHGAGVGDDYVKLSDLQDVLNAECILIEETADAHTEWVNGISYDETYYTYYIDFKYDNTIKPEAASAGKEYKHDFIDASSSYSFDLGFKVNGEDIGFKKYSPKGDEYAASVCIVNEEIYIPAYTAAMLLGYSYAW